MKQKTVTEQMNENIKAFENCGCSGYQHKCTPESRATRKKTTTLDHVQATNLRALIQTVQNMVQGKCDGQDNFDSEIKNLEEILKHTQLPKALEPI